MVPKPRTLGNVPVGEDANYTSTTATVPGCKGNGADAFTQTRLPVYLVSQVCLAGLGSAAGFRPQAEMALRANKNDSPGEWLYAWRFSTSSSVLRSCPSVYRTKKFTCLCAYCFMWPELSLPCMNLSHEDRKKNSILIRVKLHKFTWCLCNVYPYTQTQREQRNVIMHMHIYTNTHIKYTYIYIYIYIYIWINVYPYLYVYIDNSK